VFCAAVVPKRIISSKYLTTTRPLRSSISRTCPSNRALDRRYLSFQKQRSTPVPTASCWSLRRLTIAPCTKLVIY